MAIASRRRLFAAIALAGALLPIARRAAAQPAAETGAFISRLANDTLVVEQYRRTADSLTGEIVARDPTTQRVQRVRYAASLGPNATITGIVVSAWAGAADGPPARRATLRFIDSAGKAIAEVNQGSGVLHAPTIAGAVPVINVSIALLEQVVRRAHAIGGDSAVTPIFLLDGGRTFTTAVVRRSADSVWLVTGNARVSFAVDATHHIVGGADPVRRISFERSRALADAQLGSAMRRDYAAPPGAPYVAEAVHVVALAGATLGGTLTIPRSGARPYPAVLLISGSTPQDRDYHVGDYAIFRWLADTLTRRGIAVLRVDDRGVGESTGQLGGATLEDRADDVRSELALLRARPDIDPRRIALIGLAEGGVVAPMVAVSDSAIVAIVTLAGTASTGREVAHYQMQLQLARDTSRAPAARASALQAAERQLDSAAATRPWLQSFLSYDPLPTARKVRVPTLVLHGATDRNVPVSDAERLATAIRSNGNRDVTVHVLPNTNHIFVPDTDGDPQRYMRLPSLRVAPTTLGIIADWTVTRLRPR